MCDRPIILILFFLIKILIIAIPIFLIVNKRFSNEIKLNKYLTITECFLLVLLLGLRITNNCLVNNSTIPIIYRIVNYSDENEISLVSNNDSNIVREIITDEIYKTKKSGNVYYFNNNTKPLSDKKISCIEKKIYMKNYGNSLTAASIMLSTALNKNIDPIALLKLSMSNDIVNCEMGISIENVLNLIQNNYNVHYTEIDNSIIEKSVDNGIPVLTEIIYNSNSKRNLTCSKGYIVIYNRDNNGYYKILNPNEKGLTKICPEQTEGALTVIEPGSNDYSWTYEELMEISSRFWVVERN